MGCWMVDHTKNLKKIDFCHFFRDVLSLGWGGMGVLWCKRLNYSLQMGEIWLIMTQDDPGSWTSWGSTFFRKKTKGLNYCTQGQTKMSLPDLFLGCNTAWWTGVFWYCRTCWQPLAIHHLSPVIPPCTICTICSVYYAPPTTIRRHQHASGQHGNWQLDICVQDRHSILDFRREQMWPFFVCFALCRNLCGIYAK